MRAEGGGFAAGNGDESPGAEPALLPGQARPRRAPGRCRHWPHAGELRFFLLFPSPFRFLVRVVRCWMF